MSDQAMGPVLAGFVDVLSPSAAALADPASFELLLRRVDPDLVLPDPTMGGAFGPGGAITEAADVVADALASAQADVERLIDGTPPEQLAAIADLIDDIVAIIEAVEAVADAVNGLDLGAIGFPPEQRDPQYWLDLLAGIPEQLLMMWLEAELAPIHGLLLAVGVIEEDDRRTSHLHLDRSIDAVTDPLAVVGDLIGWASGLIDVDRLTGLGSDAASSLGIDGRIRTLRPEIAELLGTSQPAEARAVELPVVSGQLPDGTGFVEAGAILAAVAPGGTTIDSLLVTNLSSGQLAQPITISDTWTLHVDGSTDATALTGVVIGPGGLATATRTGGASTSLRLIGAPSRPWRPIGTETSTRVTVGGAEIGLTLDVGTQPDILVEASVSDAELIVVADDAILRTIIGADQLALPLALAADLSRRGLRLGGAGGLALHLPLDLTIGPVSIDGLDLAVLTDPGAGTLSVEATTGLLGVFGPFSASVDGLGLSLDLAIAPDGRGTIGPVDLRLGLVPPTGLGLSIQAPLTSGGGRLAIDVDAGRYEGSLSLHIAEIGIDAIVVVDTKLTTDPGWAFFASLSVAFPGIPLGFGFTLEGVGGLIALNRGVDAEALALGLRDGAADAILFPDDPVGDAEALISRLDDYFPILGGNTVIGPVIAIGWGAPTIITGQVGVIVSLPQGVITLLGSLAASLPTPEEPLLELHLDVLGSIDVPNGTLLVVASLYDSRLLGTIELSGDAAMYISVLDNPYFLLSVGGFHPGFQPPSHVPSVIETLRRMRASVNVGLGVTATIESYFAVTSNTVQFGGGFEIEASADWLLVTYTARGWFDFDILIQFSPFAIVADASAGVGVFANNKELLGVDLSVHLEGPKPWYASGSAQFKFFGINVTFDFQVGGHAPPELPSTIDVLDLMAGQLLLPEAWSVEQAGGQPSGLLLAAGVDGGAIRPDDTLVVRQGVAPLDRDMARFGEMSPIQESVSITEAIVRDGVAGPALRGVSTSDRTDWFAPAHFDVLRDTARLSAPSYEEMVAGVGFGVAGVGVDSDEVIGAPAGHETEVWEPTRDTTRPFGTVVATQAASDVIAGSAAAVATTAIGRAQVDGDTVSLAGITYVVVDRTSGEVSGPARSYSAAVDRAGLGQVVVPA